MATMENNSEVLKKLKIELPFAWYITEGIKVKI
jgi:hypothetical protein